MTEQAYDNLLVVIGASAGGLPAITTILNDLPEDFQAAVIVATHRPAELDHNGLAKVLKRNTRLNVSEPEVNEHLTCTTVYVGKPRETVKVDGEALAIKDIFSFPARMQRIDELFFSAAKSAGANAVGVVLSGMLDDGVDGLEAIARAGGRCIVQSPEEAPYESMPREALAAVDADFVGTAEDIAVVLKVLAAGRQCR